MTFDPMLILILAATIVTGLLAGASLDKAVVQLPARHRMGIVAFAGFSRANDLGNGLFFYPAMGILAAALTFIAAISAFLRTTPLPYAWPLYAATLLAILHTITTTRAAPNMLSLRHAPDDEAILNKTFDRFAAWHNARTVLQVINFAVLVWGIVVYRAA
jgi:hypothetical protein